MSTQRWKVTLLLDLEEGSHPRKFVPEVVSMDLHENEDLIDYEFDLVSNHYQLPTNLDD